MNNDFEPKKLHTITDSQQVKAYAHPARMVILQMLANERRTVSSVAKEMNVHPANITHHFRLLEKAGLILLVEKKDTGRNLEKYYRSIAHNFVVSMAGSEASEKAATVLSILRDDLTSAIGNAKSLSDKSLIGLIRTARIPQEKLAAFYGSMEQLLDSFGACDTQEGIAYTMNLSLYPAGAALPDYQNKDIIIE